ncbi:MAG: TlyA family RNA methyltransferase [Solirubrobacterales bacterium]
MSRERLDVLLTDRGLAPSREKAHAYILAGLARVDGRTVDKPGTKVLTDAVIELADTGPGYASRGGLKLAGAAETFGIVFTGRVMLDVGASTGGFTDYALQHGASRVYAVDVGYGQLDWRLRQDERVVVMERTNIRYVKPESFPETFDICTIDVSFISLALVLPPVSQLLKPDGEVVALVKPQFEAGREFVGKRGVVKDAAVHTAVLRQVIQKAEATGLWVSAVCYSPITGPNGNIEFFVHLCRDSTRKMELLPIEELVQSAHSALRGE